MNAGNDPNLDPAETYDEHQEEKTAQRKSRGCLFYGCLISFIVMVLLIIGVGFAGYWIVKGQVVKYTADQPAELPVVEVTEEELAAIETRVDEFQEKIEAGDTPEDLVLTADELNALISKNDDLNGRLHVTIADSKVAGEVSIPTDALPGGTGRFFNAEATFDVSFENGVLIVTLADAIVNGAAVPQEVIDSIGKENLAKDLYKDPETAKVLRRFESVTIGEDRIVLKPRMEADTSGEPGEGEAAEAQPDADAPVENGPVENGPVEAAVEEPAA